LSFVVQARIRLFGLHKEVLADSGKPQPTNISLGAVAFTKEVPQPPVPPPDRLTIITINERPGAVTDTLPLAFPPSDTLLEMEKRDLVYKSIPVAGPTFGLGFDKVSVDEMGDRSDQIVNLPMVDSAGEPARFVELSDGPAYGSEIGKSVAWAWMLAGAIAVVLAAIAGGS
jgi:hypothetical protein